MIDHDRQYERDAGVFFVPDSQRWFRFRPNVDAWGLQHELIHQVDVGDGVRSAIVRKTVAYVAVDEDANGYPVLERWTITKRRIIEGTVKCA